ncbi:MAG: hypothetical protein ACRET7_05605 [Burkholderiales bacterium]
MDHIARLKEEIARVRDFAMQDEARIAELPADRAAKFFARSSRERLQDLEKKLYLLQAERAREVIEWRLIGNRVENGTVPLNLLARLAGPLNRLISSAAFRIHHADDPHHGVPDDWQRLLDLRLAGIGTGSSRLFITGNVAPDLAGDSPLQDALDAMFDLLGAPNDKFVEHVHDVGAVASRALVEFLRESERESIGIHARWVAPSGQERYWDGRPQEITRVRSLLEQAGDMQESEAELEGTVSLLASTGRIELFSEASPYGKVKVSYNRRNPELVSKLSLYEHVQLAVRRATFFDPIRQRSVDRYSLLKVKGHKQIRGRLDS